MLRNQYIQAKIKYELLSLTICISNVLYYPYMDFYTFFLTFSYWNFDIAIIVLRSSISVQVSKKGICNNK